MSSQFIDDQQLVQHYIKGDEAALEMLIYRHKKKLFSYILQTVRDRQLAEDIFQDTFVKVINTLKKGNYNEEGKFMPWIARIAHNLIIDHYRREKKMPTISGGTNTDGDDFDIFSILKNLELNVEQEMVKHQIHKDLRKMIDRLPPEQREVLIMRHYYDMSFNEISDSTNVSINTALGRMRYALINLRKMIQAHQVVLTT